MLLQDSFMLKNLKLAPNTLISFSIFKHICIPTIKHPALIEACSLYYPLKFGEDIYDHRV